MNLISIIDLVLYVLIAINVGYLLLFAIASKLGRPKQYPATNERKKFAVIFPAYKEDRVIVQAVRSFLDQAYPKESYSVTVISDQMQESTNEALRSLPIQLLIANYTDSSKAKALSLAMSTELCASSDVIVIMDADNTTSPQFLDELNRAFAAGCKVVQAHRVAKNLNTSVAILDAVSEEINNSIFRSGHVALHMPSALIGSGMAIATPWFARNVNHLQTAGEDKEMEALLLKERIYIEYLEKVHVEDEKTAKKEVIKNQRKRWLAAQFGSLWNALPSLPGQLLKGNIGYVDKVFQWTMLPRVILIFLTFVLGLLTLLISPVMSIKWWVLCMLLGMSLVLGIPSWLMNRQLLKAVLQLPSIVLIMVGNLFKLKGAYKKFIHTEHGDSL